MNSLCLASHPYLPHRDIVNSLHPGKGWRDRVGGLSLPAPHPPPSPFVQNNCGAVTGTGGAEYRHWWRSTGTGGAVTGTGGAVYRHWWRNV